MRKGSRNPKYSIDLVLRQGRIIYRKEIRKFCFGVVLPIGRKEIEKAKSLKRIHEKGYESNIA